MCLITEQKEPLIAKSDMVVYKLLDSGLRSCIQFFKYEYEKVYETPIVENKSSYWFPFSIIEERFLNDNYDIVNNKYHLNPKLICFSMGFHSIKTLKNAKIMQKALDIRYSIHKFIIPKGSEYYKDGSGGVVSNKIIMIKPLI